MNTQPTNGTNNQQLYARASACLVGGVSAAWNHIPGGPIYFARARGMRLWDVDGHEYIDFMAGHSSLMFGHTSELIAQAVSKAVAKGFGCQCETEDHIELAELLCRVIPSAERVRLANTGSEATMNAIRAARAYTQRSLIVKFEGNFHGLYDYVLFSTDGSERLGKRMEDGRVEPMHGSGGMPPAVDALTVVLPYNDAETFGRFMARHGQEVAAVILEPIAFNMGYVPPLADFMQAVRTLTRDMGVVLVFDEVITGFRIGLGGAQEYLKTVPDLACFGKALGAGAPVAALVGKREIMEVLSPLGNAIMSGTNTGRWLTVAVTLEALKEYQKGTHYLSLSNKTAKMIEGLGAIFRRHQVPAYVDGQGGCICVYFGLVEQPTGLPEIAAKWNQKYNESFFNHLLHVRHVYGFGVPAPRHPERITITFAHTDQDLDETLDRVEQTLRAVPYFER